MNNLTSGQRKLIYMLGVILLLSISAWLGMPSSGELGTGGKIAIKRQEYQLGEATLGDVDPASSTMNLVLLGFRGIASSILWSEAEHYKMHKNWSQLQQTADSITLLQPHFRQVWEYQAWNLGFNVSAECDAVADRYYWVKEGAQYIMKGTRRSSHYPELQFETGRFFSQKLGKADEKEQFRDFFIHDPEVVAKQSKEIRDELQQMKIKNPGQYVAQNQYRDPAVNPDGIDNYLEAKKWYERANALTDRGLEQHRMDLPLFQAYPYHCMMDYAEAREQDGFYNENDTTEIAAWDAESIRAWKDAGSDWFNIYGSKVFTAAGTADAITFTLAGTEEDLNKMGAVDGQLVRAVNPSDNTRSKIFWQDRYRSMTNFNYWMFRTGVEQRQKLVEARRCFHVGKKAFRERLAEQEALATLLRGCQLLQDILNEEGMRDETTGISKIVLNEGGDGFIEDALKSLLIIERINKGLPKDCPLLELWTEPDLQDKRAELREKFIRWAGDDGSTPSLPSTGGTELPELPSIP